MKSLNIYLCVPNPYWLLVIASLNNLVSVLYTVALISIGTIQPTTEVWITLGVFVCVNVCVKVIPLLCLHYDVFFEENDDPYDRQNVCVSLFIGIALFSTYMIVCIHLDDPFDAKWICRKSTHGVLSGDGPLVKRIKHMITKHTSRLK
jgi:hypothetical protein